jgi:hypothetical protein
MANQSAGTVDFCVEPRAVSNCERLAPGGRSLTLSAVPRAGCCISTRVQMCAGVANNLPGAPIVHRGALPLSLRIDHFRLKQAMSLGVRTAVMDGVWWLAGRHRCQGVSHAYAHLRGAWSIVSTPVWLRREYMSHWPSLLPCSLGHSFLRQSSNSRFLSTLFILLECLPSSGR